MNKNLTATLLIILAIGIYFTITDSIIEKGKVMAKVNDEYVSAIASAKELIKIRDKVTEDYNSISATDRDRLSKMVPSSVDNIRLMIDLNEVALQHGFTLQDIKATVDSPDEVAQTDNDPSQRYSKTGSIAIPVMDTVSVSFGVSAPYQQFISFLKDIETSLRIMDVTQLSIEASDTGVYDFQVGLKTYWLRQQ